MHHAAAVALARSGLRRSARAPPPRLRQRSDRRSPRGATLIGPLIDANAYRVMQEALDEAREAGGVVIGGERLLMDRFPGAYYVRPALVEMPEQAPVV